ncbi:MAG: SDR family oxidoreductase [Proteobacteria bacterium]|nr:SDR family oxidoreductase [Pseudomonadota bacterium]
MARLAGKVAFITGAGIGIGRATAIAFAREGACLALADIAAGTAEETAHLATGGPQAPLALRCDVTDPDSISAAIAAAEKHFGKLDVLHNNAGGSTMQDGSVIDASLDEFWRVIKLDLFGTVLGCRFGIPALIRAGGGSVINMSSNLALMGIAGRDFYSAAKGGVASLTRALAVTHGKDRVRVNALAPSVTLTPRVRGLLAGNDALAKLAQSHLLGLGEAEDVANAALYLASDESRVVTGTIMRVDSGVTIS